MSDIYVNKNNKAKPAVILSWAETAVPPAVDWSIYKRPNYIMHQMVSNNDEPQCIVPFHMEYSNKPYDLIYDTAPGIESLFYWGNNNLVLNLQDYKQALNEAHAFSSDFNFTQAQRDRNWGEWSCNDTTNQFGDEGGGDFSYRRGHIHFLDYTYSDVNFTSAAHNLKTNINIYARPNANGSTIDVDLATIQNGFTLGFNGIISAEGLSNYFNTIGTKQFAAQWMGIGIKGGNGFHDSYSFKNAASIKMYSINEQTTNSVALNNQLTKRELKTDVWYIEDKNFRTYDSLDSFETNYFIKRTNGSTITYFKGFVEAGVETWTSVKSEVKFYRSLTEAEADKSKISDSAGTVTVIDNSDVYTAVNISQPVIFESTGKMVFLPSVNYGFLVTGKSGTNNIVYAGNTATYESDKWVYSNNELDGTYFKLIDDASNIVNQIAGSITNANTYKIQQRASISDMMPFPSNTLFTSLNYYIKPL